MQVELSTAASFFAELLSGSTKKEESQQSSSLSSSTATAGSLANASALPFADVVECFAQELQNVLQDKYLSHWYEDQPFRGSGFRCLKNDPGQLDPLLLKAIENTSIHSAHSAATGMATESKSTTDSNVISSSSSLSPIAANTEKEENGHVACSSEKARTFSNASQDSGIGASEYNEPNSGNTILEDLCPILVLDGEVDSLMPLDSDILEMNGNTSQLEMTPEDEETFGAGAISALSPIGLMNDDLARNQDVDLSSSPGMAWMNFGSSPESSSLPTESVTASSSESFVTGGTSESAGASSSNESKSSPSLRPMLGRNKRPGKTFDSSATAKELVVCEQQNQQPGQQLQKQEQSSQNQKNLKQKSKQNTPSTASNTSSANTSDSVASATLAAIATVSATAASTAAAQARIRSQLLFRLRKAFPKYFVMWIDPGCVAYREGHHGAICTLYDNGKFTASGLPLSSVNSNNSNGQQQPNGHGHYVNPYRDREVSNVNRGSPLRNAIMDFPASSASPIGTGSFKRSGSASKLQANAASYVPSSNLFSVGGNDLNNSGNVNLALVSSNSSSATSSATSLMMSPSAAPSAGYLPNSSQSQLLHRQSSSSLTGSPLARDALNYWDAGYAYATQQQQQQQQQPQQQPQRSYSNFSVPQRTRTPVKIEDPRLVQLAAKQ